MVLPLVLVEMRSASKSARGKVPVGTSLSNPFEYRGLGHPANVSKDLAAVASRKLEYHGQMQGLYLRLRLHAILDDHATFAPTRSLPLSRDL
jgi:hypothetical protein